MRNDDLWPTILRRDLALVSPHFSTDALARICTLHEEKFGEAFGLEEHRVASRRPAWLGRPNDPDNFYFFRDNGANVLAVAHLDTVADRSQRAARFLRTEGGPVVYSRALDDRLGAYIILDLLPKLGITYDVLLTVGEESGNSTAQYFDTPKQYDWMIEFDRGGTDVVMYDYEDAELAARVVETGAVVGNGIFSDICYLDHLGIKGINWGVGYRDYHEPRSHAYLDDTFSMVAKYVRFHEHNAGIPMPHQGPDDYDDLMDSEEGDLFEVPAERRRDLNAAGHSDGFDRYGKDDSLGLLRRLYPGLTGLIRDGGEKA